MLVADRASQRRPMTVHAELDGPAWPTGSRWSVGTTIADDGRSQFVLYPGAFAVPDVDIDPATALVLPTSLAPSAAILLPLAVEALRAWDTLHTEIGAAALVTTGTPWSPVLLEAARWYGAVPVPLDTGGEVEGGTEMKDGDTVSRLRSSLDRYGAVSAVELTGRADMVDLLLEAITRQSRVLFAGTSREPLTIDFYVNVHRKGLHLASTVLSPEKVFDPAADRRLVDRASQLLMNGTRSEAFGAAVAGACTGRAR